MAGESIARGYWKNQQATEATFNGRLKQPITDQDDGVRWLRTGDMGFIAEGELFITGRLRELIIIAGRNHFPVDLERTAESAEPTIATSGAVAFSVDIDRSERLIIVAELRREYGKTAANRRRAISILRLPVVACAPRLPPNTKSPCMTSCCCVPAEFRGPRAGRSVAEIRETAILPRHWSDLRILFMTPLSPEISNGHIPRSAGDIRAWVVAELARSLNVGPGAIDPAAPLETLGVDSLLGHRNDGGLSAWLVRDLPATLMWEHGSINALAQALADSDAFAESAVGRAWSICNRTANVCRSFAFLVEADIRQFSRPWRYNFAPHTPVTGWSSRDMVENKYRSSAWKRLPPRCSRPFAAFSRPGLTNWRDIPLEDFLRTNRAAIDRGRRAGVTTGGLRHLHARRTSRPTSLAECSLHAWLLLTSRDYPQYLRNRLKRRKPRRNSPANKAEPAASDAVTTPRQGAVAAFLADDRAAANYQPLPYPCDGPVPGNGSRVHNAFYKMDETNGWGAFLRVAVSVLSRFQALTATCSTPTTPRAPPLPCVPGFPMSLPVYRQKTPSRPTQNARPT